MRIHRLVAFLSVAVLVPCSSALAQTCVGTASFADGPNRIGGEYQFNDNFSTWTAGYSRGADKSWYGGVSVDGTQISHGGSSSTGFGAMLGYQFPIADSPLQFCPAATAHYTSGGGYNTTAFGLDGNLGYRIAASDNFALVPSVGLRWVSMNASGGGGSATETNIVIALGLVVNKTWTFIPGVFIPSQTGGKTSTMIGVKWNWGK